MIYKNSNNAIRVISLNIEVNCQIRMSYLILDGGKFGSFKE